MTDPTIRGVRNQAWKAIRQTTRLPFLELGDKSVAALDTFLSSPEASLPNFQRHVVVKGIQRKLEGAFVPTRALEDALASTFSDYLDGRADRLRATQGAIRLQWRHVEEAVAARNPGRLVQKMRAAATSQDFPPEERLKLANYVVLHYPLAAATLQDQLADLVDGGKMPQLIGDIGRRRLGTNPNGYCQEWFETYKPALASRREALLKFLTEESGDECPGVVRATLRRAAELPQESALVEPPTEGHGTFAPEVQGARGGDAVNIDEFLAGPALDRAIEAGNPGQILKAIGDCAKSTSFERRLRMANLVIEHDEHLATDLSEALANLVDGGAVQRLFEGGWERRLRDDPALFCALWLDAYRVALSGPREKLVAALYAHCKKQGSELPGVVVATIREAERAAPVAILVDGTAQTAKALPSRAGGT